MTRTTTPNRKGSLIGTWWRAVWLYGTRWWPFGVIMAVATLAFGWWLVGLLTEPVGPAGPTWLATLPEWLQDLARTEHADKLAHAGLFAATSVLALVAMFHLGFGSRLRCGILTVLIVGLLFGTATELAQANLPTRHFDVWDIVADTVGSLIAVTLWLGLGFLVAGIWRERRSRAATGKAGAKGARHHRTVPMMPIGLQSRFVPHPDVEVQADPNATNNNPATNGHRREQQQQQQQQDTAGLLLVHLRTGVAFRLNSTGQQVWPGIQRGETVHQLSQRLEKLYPQTEHARLRHDTESLLRSLWTHDLVKPKG